MQNYTDVFISYGRKESKTFAAKLYNRLLTNGYTAWFDQNDIPLGVDYQNQIDDGIEKAHNFIFIISPHSVSSPYCRLEVELALRRNKRIIPILHVESFEFEKMHPAISKINWIYARENSLDSFSWDNATEIDDFEKAFLGLATLLEQQKNYVQQHTQILQDALAWERHHKSTQHLLVGQKRHEAEKWLLTEFTPPSQPPCLPSDLHAEFICESKKNASNLMTEVFISYDTDDAGYREDVKKSLEKYGITSWVHNKDIQSGMDFETAIFQGIEQADNFLFFISKQSVESEWCLKELDYAIKLNKRVIPLLIEVVPNAEIPASIRQIQYINFTDNKERELARQESSDYQKDINDLIRELYDEASYYNQHKVFLCQALKWERNNKKGAFLLRGYNLQNAQTFLSAGKSRSQHKPTQIHQTFIEESIAKIGQLGSEVFVSYSRNDSDFARHLNNELQLIGKTTWFDQESIATGANFQKEIYRGIENSDNFLFLISPQAIDSIYCEEEVSYAATLNKRFVTVLSEPLDAETMTKFKALPKLSEVQWIDFHKQEFNKAFYELLTTLDTDREHVQLHTKYSQRATDWQDRDRTTDLLLQGSQLSQAQAWLLDAETNKKQPEATEVVKEFIEISKQVEIQKLELEKKRQAKEAKLEQEKAEAMQQSLLAAERAAAEAQKAADEAQRSLAIQKRASIVQKVLGAIVGVIALIAMYTAYTVYLEKQNTEQAKLRAESNEEKAKKEKERAERLFIEANKRKREAEANAQVAHEQTQLAENSMLLAQRREYQVRLEEKKTKAALAQAETSQMEMETAYEIARKLLQESEVAKQQAERQAELATIARQEMESRETKLEQILQSNVETASRKKGTDYAQDLLKLADFYELRAKYTKSDSLYNEAIRALRTENKKSDAYTNMLKSIGGNYFDRYQYDKALALYKEAQTIIKEMHGEDSESNASALNKIGLTYNRKHQYKEAIDYMFPALEIRKKLLGETSRTYGISVSDIGLIYLSQGRYDKAAEMFTQAIEIEKINKAENSTNSAVMISNLATAKLNQQEYDEAEKLYLQALDIRKKHYTQAHPDYLRTIDDLGDLYNRKGDYEQSAKYYQKAVDIKKSSFGEAHPEYASAVAHLGLVYYNAADYGKALEYFIQSVKVMDKGNHKDYSYTVYVKNVSNTYKMLNQNDSAQKYLNLAAMTAKKSVGEGAKEYLLQINKNGNAFYEKGDFSNALELYKEAAEKELATRNITPDYRIYIHNTGLAYKAMGETDKAIDAYAKRAEAQKIIKGENSDEYALDLNDLANLYYYHPKEHPKAAELYKQAAKIHADKGDTNSDIYQTYLRNFGIYNYNIAKNYQVTLQTFQQLVNLQKAKGENNQLDYAQDVWYMALIYQHQKDEKCVAFFEEAAQVYKQQEGETRNYHSIIKSLSDFLFFTQKDYKKAEIYHTVLCNNRRKAYQNDQNENTKKDFVKELRILSYTQILNKKWIEAEKIVLEGQKISHDDIRFDIRLALIYSFSNRFEKGKAILLKHKETMYPSETNKKRPTKEVYQEMYADLLAAKHNEKILESLKKVIE
jgi:tetratricopeptide (TPR) repeat protein